MPLLRSGEPTNLINGTAMGQTLIGSNGNDQIKTFYGKVGSSESSMYGGLGDDTYITLSSRDRIYEEANSGTDTVKSDWFYALSANVENLVLTGTLSVGATGNDGSNVIIGNSGKNIIEGGLGDDELTGGAGNDMFVVAGRDIILDFSPGDYVDLRGFTGVTSFDQVAAALKQQGADTVLTIGPNDVITIKNTVAADLAASDFVLNNDKAGYKLTFSDEFDTLSLHTEHGDNGTWYPLYPRTGIAAHSTPDKGSVQYFTYIGDTGSTGELVGLDPFSVSDGVVTISMNPVAQDQQSKIYGLDYSAGMLNTIGSFSQTYGYFEARMKFAAGQGIHDAFWMLPIDGGGQFEIDVGEQRGSEPGNVLTVTHAIDDGRDISHSKGTSVPTATTEFHTYGVDWEPDYTTFYIDGIAVRTQPTFPGLDKPMYMLASIGGGGLYSGAPDSTTPFPAKMEVDYIRAYASQHTVEKGVAVNKTGIDGADTLYGTNLGDTLNGGGGDDKVFGGAGDDTLTGGGGSFDVLDGGFGDDTYLVYAASDRPQEGGSTEKGIDTVKTTLSQYTLSQNLENLIYIGSDLFSGTGNIEANYLQLGSAGGSLSGQGGDDVLQGGAGSDTLSGGDGNDAAHGGDNNDSFRGNAGNDTFYGDEGDDIIKGDDGNDVLYGGSGYDKLYGGAGSDVIDGGSGKDQMYGGTGDDTYYIDLASDIVVEYGSEGVDTIYTNLSNYVLPNFVENVIYTGTGSFTVTGNGSGNRFIGTVGADRMTGLAGDDTYVVNNIGDAVNEIADGGIDTIEATAATYTLGSNIENLIYVGSLTGSKGFNGTGNALSNVLKGGAGTDRLDGKTGADSMSGGGGNDTYVVDNVGDVVTEQADQGKDRVLSQISYALTENVETLQLSTSKGLSGTGNALANIIIGNGGANVLDGRGGADMLTGGAGTDTFVFRNGEGAGDSVTDFAGAGVMGGDLLQFIGFGTSAYLTQVGGTDQYVVHASLEYEGVTETIRLVGVTNLGPADYIFL